MDGRDEHWAGQTADVERASLLAVGHQLFDRSPAGMALLDLDGRFLESNASLQGLLHRSTGELAGLSLDEVTHWDDVVASEAAVRDLTAGRRDSLRLQRRLVRPDGAVVVGDVALCLVRDEYGGAHRVVLQVVDITEGRRSTPERAGSDPLTGLAGRSALRTLLGHALRLSEQVGVLAVVHVDVSGLLSADDPAEPRRDHVLHAVARCLVDTVGSDGVVGRAGTDEFVILLDEAPSRAVVDATADGLRVALEGVAAALGVTHPRVAIGIVYPDRGLDGTTDRAAAADAAVGAARAAAERSDGPDRTPVDEVVAAAELQSVLAEEEEALAGVVTAWFQPVVDLNTGSVVGNEALARWRHPQRGVLRPAQFMPAAEGRGLTARIDDAVLDHACRHLATGRGAGYISVNLSRGFTERPGLGARVRAPLARHGVDPALLVLELTEAVALELSPTARRDLEDLDAEGVRVFLDDFGSGYGALAVFDDLPVRGIKLDRGLLHGAEGDPNRARMLGAIREMAEALGVDGVVEGVETADEARRVRDVGWRHAQGYLFGSPQPTPSA